MSVWPESDGERLAGVLLRVDLYEGRYLAVGEHHNVVNHLLRAASAACLLDREPEALALLDRVIERMIDWVGAVGQGRARSSTYADFSATRGLLAFALAADGRRSAAHEAARVFLRQTETAPPGSVHNARLAAATLIGDRAAIQTAARSCELSDAGLGLPWKRFAHAIDTEDAAAAGRLAHAWLREKSESTHTNEWGAYNEIPLEVSAALALAAARGVPVKLTSDRILTALRG